MIFTEKQRIKRMKGFLYVWKTVCRFNMNRGVIERTEDVNEVGAKIWQDGWLGFFGRTGKYWLSAEVAVDFLERHHLRLFYGYERGGHRCTDGVRRQVNPSMGVKITFSSYF